MVKATWLSAAATGLAAIAAALSVAVTLITARTQVQATYNDTIYNKQVDTLGIIIEETYALRRSVDAFQGHLFFDDNRSKAEIVLGQPVDPEIDDLLLHGESDVRGHAQKLQSAVTIFKLIAPTELDDTVDSLAAGGDDIARSYHELAIVVKNRKQHLDELEFVTGEVMRLDSSRVQTLDSLTSCLQPILERGEYLSTSAINVCHLFHFFKESPAPTGTVKP